VKHWIIGAAVVIAIGLVFGVLFFSSPDMGSGGHEVISRSVAADGTETIIVHDGERHFFPFGLFIFPLVGFGLLWLARDFALRGRGPGPGPWMRGGLPAGNPPAWIEEWHRRLHASPEPPPPASQPADGQQET